MDIEILLSNVAIARLNGPRGSKRAARFVTLQQALASLACG